ncbi:MAG: arginine repressor [Ignavibacterium sp.]
MSAKLKRQTKIKDLLNANFISSQEELLGYLDEEGIDITQATLSRDFAELGVVRVFTERGVRYVLNSEETGKQIAKLIGFEILSIEQNESIIVIRTLAGRAQGVAHYIDRLNRKEIIGTVGGDDTVIVIPNKQQSIQIVVEGIKRLMAEVPQSKTLK